MIDFLQVFHSELSKAMATSQGLLKWRIEQHVFDKINLLASSRGATIQPNSLILFFPFEIGVTSNGTVELVSR